MENNDHDLLIQLNTKVEILLSQQADFIRNSNNQISGMTERIVALETKDSRDSEKVRAISEDVQRSLANREKIISLEEKVSNLQADLAALKSKANIWDIANSLGVAVAAIIAFFMGR